MRSSTYINKFTNDESLKDKKKKKKKNHEKTIYRNCGGLV